MALRTCLDCGQLTNTTRCPDCRATHDTLRRPSFRDRYGPGFDTIREQVLERDGRVCQLQLGGCTGVATTADHVIPRSQGGRHTPDNLRAACQHCNTSRGDGLRGEPIDTQPTT